eukprot:SAG11_NODE_2354_length_3476_cov_1.793012_3_plen_82_part_00
MHGAQHSVELTQPDFIRSLVNQFQDHLPSRASAPCHPRFNLSMKNPAGSVTSEEEKSATLKAGYQLQWSRKFAMGFPSMHP